MRGLTAKDSGKYSCAVRTGVTDVCTDHELVVRDVMTGAYGDSVNITCKYQGSHKQPLYLCRAKSVGHWEFEDLLVTSLSPYHSRYFLNDDKHDGVFTVTITDLRSEDAGIYWCGELAAETKTVVRLKVTRVSILPTILSVSLAVVVVVVMGAVVFMFYRHRRNKTPERSSDGANSRSNSQAPHPDRTYEEINDNPAAHPGPSTAFHPDPTYEEIKDNPALSAAAHPGPSTVYATAQLPTVLSDDPTYSTAELPTVLSDDPTYSTAELPTNPCADSTVSFNEGPTTASVTFRQENCANSTVGSDQ
ncbi:uncharacterized protein LOC105913334 [Clupea harengus]|uniref:Uncharacterized protein LOC105913334 n=1 Tax=Clupea harengus TaxID=7950 RepID=A0A6P8F0H4_CLUHA|nr:uncharacterized protein LOC105913334 [Clupea harengus]